MNALPLAKFPQLDRYLTLADEVSRIRESPLRDQAIRDWAGRLTQSEPAADRVEARVADWLKAEDVSNWDLLAQLHGFANGEIFAFHVQGLNEVGSPTELFESAVDAIVEGNAAKLSALVSTRPGLIHQRSLRIHRSTLLHYVSANGVEDYRQRTPANIVEIARILLAAGADVNAESEAYGGRSTTLALTATSCHPDAAGVQISLLELLIERRALIDLPGAVGTVNACLANGRGAAAEYLAGRGARLDFAAAAGVGRPDLVARFWEQESSAEGFAWACQFGRTAVVQYLIDREPNIVSSPHKPGGETGLHWAAHNGHAELVRLLIDRGAPIDARDDRFDGRPLDWALHGWMTAAPEDRRGRLESIALLAQAGATTLYATPADPSIQEALRGRVVDAD